MNNPDGPSISCLSETVHSWQTSEKSNERELFDKFCSIYDVHQDIGHNSIPDPFKEKLSRWLPDLPSAAENVQEQLITVVRNKVLEEETLFNHLRQKRIKPRSPAERTLVQQLMKDSSKDCDFCCYKHFTAEDVPFGRIETEWAYTAANVFKIDAWNSLVIFRGHDVLSWSEETFIDAFCNAASQWFDRVHSIDSSYCYPFIAFDLLPSGGASQLHPHFHVMLAKNGYRGKLDFWRQRINHYTQQQHLGYFDIDIELHRALGLCIELGNAVAMTSLTPLKDNECVFVSPQNNVDFYRLLNKVIRVFMDDLSLLSLSLAIALPSLKSGSDSCPMFGRLVSRGICGDIRSDVGALDFFMAPSISTDPFVLAGILKQKILRNGDWTF